jgi:hypothetical protein
LGKINIGLIFLLTLFLFSCEDPNEIGLELTGDPDRIGSYYQEIELATSLINNDSLFTLSVQRLLIGETYNSEFGKLSASSYSQFGFSNQELNIPDSATYDSLVLDIKNDYAYGTGIVNSQRFTVHELTEDLYDTAAYFSFSSAEYDPNPIATGDFLLPERNDTILSFKIDDSYGQRLFEAAQDTNMIDPDDANTIHQLFKGFAFISDLNNNSVMGINVINDSTALRLYYTYDDSTYNYPFIFFSVANFNRIVTDRAGSPLQGIEDVHYEEFFPENEKSYIQSGADLITKVDFTPFLDFFDTIEYATINQSIISITIDEPGFNELPPSSVVFYYTDETNRRIRIGNQYIGINQEGSTDLLRLLLDEEELNYQGPISIFCDNLIKGNIADTTVLMYPPEFGITNTVNQMLVSPGKIILEIYYSKVK